MKLVANTVPNSDSNIEAAPSRARSQESTPALPVDELKFLDGLRGLAAAYVVLHHIYLSVLPYQTITPRLAILWKCAIVLRFGKTAVDLFIVLSGFCLMLPVTRSPDGQLRGGTRGYLKRRARRILPPYYAAVLLSVLIPILIPAVGNLFTPMWNLSGAPTSARSIGSHLFLIHDFFISQRYSLNAPMWSVAVEAQIYVLLPLIFLPIWRRWGIFPVLGIGVAIGSVVLLSGRGLLLVNVTLFIFGMLASELCFSSINGMQNMGNWCRRAALPVLAIAIGVRIYFAGTSPELGLSTANDLAVGVAVVVAIISWAKLPQHPGKIIFRLTRAVLEWPVVLFLGVFSYSIYLMHMPVIACTQAAARAYLLSPTNEVIVLFAATPLVLASCYAFYLLFERPTLTRRRSNRPNSSRQPALQDLVSAAIEQPAP